MSSVLKFLRRKNYQYEVTFSLYMLTPTEKIVLNTILLFIFSMALYAISLYLPNHFKVVGSRLWFYVAGDDSLARNNGGLFMDEVKSEL
ncbi:hypothetical protein BJ508DRAFT_419952 [Ascobolus immersus RN42]|uniref:Uncharacterized protein n=1 Tax=Ascobolus immersus RN42 TaxID=1160509 RepID=A0A3N4H9L3_ASCIM|nr:hypothetical protein BJ508DRAFT_419952 [Ascobolus immersus RN42]